MATAQQAIDSLISQGNFHPTARQVAAAELGYSGRTHFLDEQEPGEEPTRSPLDPMRDTGEA